jgi:hypothetical protein
MVQEVRMAEQRLQGVETGSCARSRCGKPEWITPLSGWWPPRLKGSRKENAPWKNLER